MEPPPTFLPFKAGKPVPRLTSWTIMAHLRPLVVAGKMSEGREEREREGRRGGGGKGEGEGRMSRDEKE